MGSPLLENVRCAHVFHRAIFVSRNAILVTTAEGKGSEHLRPIDSRAQAAGAIDGQDWLYDLRRTHAAAGLDQRTQLCGTPLALCLKDQGKS